MTNTRLTPGVGAGTKAPTTAMRRLTIILVSGAILLALGLVGPRVRPGRGIEPRTRSASTPNPALASSASDAAKEAREGGPSVRDRWRRSQGNAHGSHENPTESDGPPSGGASLSWVDRLFSNDGATPLSRQTVDRWLEAGHTNAADLLALRQAGAGIEHLETALRRFPEDPRVLLASTGLRDTTEIVRERMDRFRQADPQNALADYLSAWNELAAGNRDKALEHLAAANTKPGFEDYTADAAQAAQELYRFEGRSEAEAVAMGSSSVHLPHLAHLKTLANGLADLQKELVATGDMAGAEHLARMGHRLGEQLATGPGSMTLIGELVGLAVERISVQNLPQDTTYDFLGGSADSLQQDLNRRRAEIRSVSGQLEPWIRGASEADVVAYFGVMKEHGERTALEWLRDQNAPPVP